jgi:hypothetical protein
MQHVANVNAVCDSYNASAPHALRLDVSAPQLVAPVVVVAHARTKYLARAMTAIIRWDGCAPLA